MTNIVVGDISSGLRTDRPPFLINNDAFPTLNNAYAWRGRVLKKRGTSLLGRLQRIASVANALTAGSINLISALSLEANSSIVPGSINLVGSVDGTTYTDPLKNGTLTATGGTGTGGTINYSTGVLTITGGGTETLTGTIQYNPSLPVMGIRNFNQNFTGSSTPNNILFPLYVFFDTTYSYLYKDSTGPFYDVNYFYGSGAHFTWSGQDYQQFWTTNYQGAMWTTNNVPGFNALNGTYTSGSGTANITMNLKTFGGVNFTTLIVNDVLFFNEWNSGGSTINNLTGTITNASGAASGNYVITFSSSQTVAGSGLVQVLTNTVPGQDGIKYFIGDPIGSPPSPVLTKGWVNFSPPLSNAANPSYLVGAKIIIPFKNRLLFFGTWTQTSTGSAIYNPNQLVACQNGTVFYANTGLPPNQTADPTSFYQNVVGKGLRLNAPLSQEIICVSQNNDVLIVILERQPLKLYSTGDDSAPFLYQTVSTEFGAESTFSAIPLDSGVLSIGPYGYTMTDQNSARRIDLPIPDEVFSINEDNKGIERVCAVRDYREEFIYFTFPSNSDIVNNQDQIPWVYPTTTLAFNYRDNMWSTFTENYTSYGYFQYNENYTWADLGNKFGTWNGWTNPWNFGSTQSKYSYVAGGNQQGFVLLKQPDSTTEAQSQYISAITITGSGIGTIVTISSPNHNLNDGDYILIEGVLGVTNLNGNVFKISTSPSQVNTFNLLLTVTQQNSPPTGSYLGAGTYSRLTNFNIVTKQFPMAWSNSRQTRLGTQKFLFATTPAGRVTVNLYVNESPALIANTVQFSGYLPFSNVVQTCPENSNLNLTQHYQDQIWHRLNTSVIGDTVQLEFTQSDDQMRDPNCYNADFILYGFVLTAYPGPVLA